MGNISKNKTLKEALDFEFFLEVQTILTKKFATKNICYCNLISLYNAMVSSS